MSLDNLPKDQLIAMLERMAANQAKPTTDFVLIDTPPNYRDMISPLVIAKEQRKTFSELQNARRQIPSYGLLLPKGERLQWSSAIKLMDYQEEFTKFAVSRPDVKIRDSKIRNRLMPICGCYNQDKTGMGKTYQGIRVAWELWLKYDWNKPVLIITKKGPSVKQWAKSIKKALPKAEVFIDRVPFQHHPDGRYFIITHYESLRKEYYEVREKDDPDEIELDEMDDEELLGIRRKIDMEYSTVILDEAHKVRNTSVDNTKAVQRLKYQFWLPMSGTPYHRDPSQQWAMLHQIDPVNFPTKCKMQDDFTNFENTRFGRKVKGLKSAQLYADAVKHVVMGRTVHEVFPDHETHKDFMESVDMELKQIELYNEMRRGNVVPKLNPDDEFDNLKIANALAEIMRRQQVTSNPDILFPHRKIPNAKLEWIENKFEDVIPPNKDGTIDQFIIFCKFRQSAKAVFDVLKSKGHTAGLLFGDRKEMVVHDKLIVDESYNDNDDDKPKVHEFKGAVTADVIDDAFKAGKIQFLISTHESGGTALDYRPLAHVTTIFYDVHWSHIQMEQAIGRTSGTTNPEARMIIYLIIEGTVDALILKSFQQGMSDKAMVSEFMKDMDRY